jgi:ribonuclease J
MAQNELVFAPLGGIGEIGMNLSIYGFGDERRRQWLIVDCGVSFASEEQLPGVDLILPDIRFLIAERKNIVGLVLTHGHEDHLGALIDLWPRLKVPLYATPFTAALFEAKRLSEPGAPQIPVKVVPLGGRLNLGPFTVDFINVAHSIPESNALAIRTPAGIVLHTGDWKIDPTPILGPPTDQARLTALGDEGVLALVGDSTNAVRDGRSPSEADVARTLAELIRTAPPWTAKWFWSAAPWSASRKLRARPAISTACRISAAWRATAICPPTRFWRCAPAARASRARRCRASPRTSIPR